MNPVGAYSVDALLRGPAQGPAFASIGAAPGDSDASETTGGGIAEQRAESLKTVPGNRIEMPSADNPITKPKEGAPAMDDAEAALSGIAALMAKFAKAQEMVR